jgi:hypothetical protein
MRCIAALLSRTYVFAAFDGRWLGVTFLILALSGKLALGPYSARYPGPSQFHSFVADPVILTVFRPRRRRSYASRS